MLLAALRLKPRPLPFSLFRRFAHTRPVGMADLTVNKTAHPFDRTRLEALLNRRFFYAPAFEIYGGA